MPSSRPQLRPWWRASSLTERLALPGRLEPVEATGWDQAATRWQQESFLDDEVFARRLATAGVSRQELGQALLPAFESALAGHTGAEWTEAIDRVARYRLSGLAWEELSALEGAGLKRPPKPPFFGFVSRFLQDGADRLRRLLLARTGHPGGVPLGLAPEVEKQLLLHLLDRLLRVSQRTLVLAMNVARLQGRLAGSTPEERFDHFSVAWFRDPRRFVGFLAEYPVLARLLVSTVDLWVRNSGEILVRHFNDRAEIGARFQDGGDPGLLLHCRPAGSDPHRGGQSVFFLRFGSGLDLVYKPRSLALDSQFQLFLQWLGERGLGCRHRTLRIWNRGEYGWSEVVQPQTCGEEGQIRRFYRRQGSLLAICHLLNGTDFHQENLIAAGEHPVLVDLEALFFHRLRRPDTERAVSAAHEALERSVGRVGLLPVLVFVDRSSVGIDISGLGGGAAGELPFEVLTVAAERSDEMRFEKGKAFSGEAGNRPTLGGEPVQLEPYLAELESGFSETYRFFCEHRDEVHAQLQSFAEVEVRHLLRPTNRYGRFLQEGYHPDLLRSGLARDRLLEKLWAQAAARPELERAVAFEIEDLWRGDIPYFSARPGQRHLWSSGGTQLRDFFEQSSLADSEELLSALGPEDLERQIDFIRKSILATLPVTKAPVRRSPGTVPADRKDFLAAAILIGERLKDLAVHGRSDVAWIGFVPAGAERQWRLSALPNSLYEGTGGISLFLGYLAALTGREDFTELAGRGVEAMLADIALISPQQRNLLGAYQGLASYLYVLHHCAALERKPGLLDAARRLLDSVEANISLDEEFDILGGAAGCAVVLLDLFRTTGDQRFRAAALQCGDRLRTRAVRHSAGAGWVGRASGRALTGFSHGAAGVAWSLAELGRCSGQEGFFALRDDALTFERSHFLPGAGNWADLRFGDAGQTSGYSAWCNGAPGIVLSRLLLLAERDDAVLREEIATGVETTLRTGFGFSHSLCHGDLGNAEIVFRAGELLGREDWRRQALGHASAVCQEVQAGRWRCGVGSRYVETPGLMVGLAGIGYNLLRFADPERVPSVLCLEGPRPLA